MNATLERIPATMLFIGIAMAVVAALIAASVLYLVFFYLRPYDKPKRGSPHVIADPDPDAHGDVTHIVTAAVYPRTARIRDIEPKGM